MGTGHRDYFHLDLRIGRNAEGYFARVERSPHGEGAVRIDLECSLAWLDRLEPAADPCRNLVPSLDPALPPTSRDEAERVGRALGREVFQGVVQRCYDDGLTAATREGEALAIRLRVDGETRLLRFPWEVMFGPGGRSPLATSVDTPLLRVVEAGGAPPPPPGVAHLRVLLASAQPRGFAKLGVDQEVEGVRASLARRWFSPAIRLQVLPHATAAGLRKEMEGSQHHVVHFIGHGLPPTDGREGQLVFETEHGDPDLVGGQRLAGILGLGTGREHRNQLRLVVLNACHGAESEPSDGFAGVAQRLLAEGLPAAVAMRYAIADTAAVRFSEVFYRRLAKGETVARAISRARYALHAEVRDCSWLKPVLFQRARDADVVLRAGRWRRAIATAGALALLGGALLLNWLGRDPYGRLVPPLPLGSGFFADDKRCPSPDGLSLGFAYVEPGEFVMGSEEDVDEAPPHTVTITRSFCLGKTEVTVAQWEAVASDGSRSFEELRALPDGDMPKGFVSLEEVRVWVAKLDRMAGRGAVFLPDEAQWEYAARAGSSGRYSFGDSAGDLPRWANCGHGSSIARARSRRVAAYTANSFGLYDMHGNLSEWVESPFDFYRPGAEKPFLRPDPLWIRRGGSYNSSADTCRSAARASSQPTTRRKTYGFRIARWPVPSSPATEP